MIPIGTQGPMGFGLRLRSLRTRANLHQHQIATRIHVSQTIVCSWERGVSYPTYWNLVELARLFNADLNWLAGHTVKETA